MKGGITNMFETYEWTYKIKDSRIKVVFMAREQKTVEEMIYYLSMLVHNPPTKLIKKKKVFIDEPPYPIEQRQINLYKQKCKERGLIADA